MYCCNKANISSQALPSNRQGRTCIHLLLTWLLAIFDKMLDTSIGSSNTLIHLIPNGHEVSIETLCLIWLLICSDQFPNMIPHSFLHSIISWISSMEGFNNLLSRKYKSSSLRSLICFMRREKRTVREHTCEFATYRSNAFFDLLFSHFWREVSAFPSLLHGAGNMQTCESQLFQSKSLPYPSLNHGHWYFLCSISEVGLSDKHTVDEVDVQRKRTYLSQDYFLMALMCNG